MTPEQAAELVLQRREISQSLTAWCRYNGYEPAPHHALLINGLERVVRGEIKNLIVCLPPGSAKSTYISYMFPVWFLQTKLWAPVAPPHIRTILACSYSKDMIQGFGRRCRNLIELEEKTLDYALTRDSKAADEWETTNMGRYFCAGVGGGIAGHRADIGFVDDPIGAEDDADSQQFRDKQWLWWWNDFLPRIYSWGAKIIVANRRHEDDLVGRLLVEEGKDWHTIIVPFFPVENDPLGRKPVAVDTAVLGDRTKSKAELALESSLKPLLDSRLWPSYYSAEKAVEVLRAPARTRSGLWQQAPSPEEGSFFRKDMFIPYASTAELPKDLRIYVASDHAVSSEQIANGDRHCLLPCGLDAQDDLWILPDVWWKQAETDEAVEAMLSMMRRRKPLVWWGEAENIFKSFYPFLRRRMREEQVYVNIEKLTPSKRKEVRAQAIQGLASMGKLHVPIFASWWPDALRELLVFPGGKHDDFVDPLAYLGLGLERLRGNRPAPPEKKRPGYLTFGWLKESHRQKKLARFLAVDDT